MIHRKFETDSLLNDNYPPISNYGVIGDLRTIAMIGDRGSIDALCWPHFDSPSIFAAHVDREKGGRFQLMPELEDFTEKKLYLPDTNILLSRFLSHEGIAEVSDFMFLDGEDEHQAVVRRAKSVHGSLHFHMLCSPKFDYARGKCELKQTGEKEITFQQMGGQELCLRLRASVPLKIKKDMVVATFELKEGETETFVLESGDATTLIDEFPVQAFKATSNYWRSWIQRSKYRGRWKEMVNRSALALKLLTSRDYGSIIAAPCFGFPNEVGGERNWDYRFTWIRDASFTIYALMRLGFTDEAKAFMNWLEERCKQTDCNGNLNIMYKFDGSPIDGEEHLDHLQGYKNSVPVRVGSTNHDQVQLDIYGELMDSAYLYDKFGTPVSHFTWNRLQEMTEFVCEHWQQPDAGIWEVRSGNHEFLYSRVMCWVTVDRAVRLAQKRSLPGPLEKWIRIRNEIYDEIHERHWNEERQAFTQFKGADAMDASALIMPLVKFISPTDPRWLSTMEAITNDLVSDSLVLRYRVGEAFPDELNGKEGTFSICSFWYIECVSRQGDLPRARLLFEKMLSYGNQLGLFSEQIGTNGDFLGNIPQAFTHLALISTAFELDRALDESPQT